MAGPILVTGASGFIGGHIALSLAGSGRPVRAQYRRRDLPEHLAAVRRDGGELERADLTDADHVRRLVSGCSGVIHAAAAVDDYGPYEHFERMNYRATVELMRAAREAGCSRFTFISSISVHGFGPHRDSTEDGPYYPLVSNYQRTKKLAEDEVLAAPQNPMSTTAVRPGLVYGPGDRTTLKPVFDLLVSGSMPTISGFRSLTCPIYVTDLVDAVVRAHEAPVAAGRVYDVTSGERVHFREAIEYACELLGARLPRFDVPIWIARAAAKVLETVYTVLPLRGRPLLTTYLVDQIRHDFHFSIARATGELGFTPSVDWRTGLELAVRSYRNDESFFVDSDRGRS